jgi:cytochrome b subunit of formate dehydrogenase
LNISTLASWISAAVIAFAGLACQTGEATAAEPEKPAESAPPAFTNETCLGCHGNEGFAMPGPTGEMRSLYVPKGRFERSVHGNRLCVECHKNITEIPHKPGTQVRVSCVQCHETLWQTIQAEHKTQEFSRLGLVVQRIASYMKSVHARPSREDQSRTNATCYNCHDPHSVYPKGSAGFEEWRANIPNTCGKCHSAERAMYVDSVHGTEAMVQKNRLAPVCSDCHTTHGIDDPAAPTTQLIITQNCGNCHRANLVSYTGTYHGQVNTLGYAYTAKCFDCHASHWVQRVDDPRSTVHPSNRLTTCQKCHTNATPGFITFEPHGNTHDFRHYPYMWVASKFMIALLIGVFAFFWAHSALWFYREHKDRQAGKTTPHVVTDHILMKQGKQFQRFKPLWRLAHLAFAISVMMLVLTGMAVFYADTAWAKAIMVAFGSPRVAGIVHRVSATIMLGIFFVHLVYMVFRIARNWKTFDWFGPHSLVPRWKDLEDATSMFRWFMGKGPRPAFDRWTYWEKFDYWAVFWGMGIIGGSGVMLAFPNATASILPGWIFNVATLVHGEEAFLAAVFLFTVHFFNNHFRPEKYPPPDIVMFTGSMPLEDFRREHRLEYERLLASGELDKHLVDAPSEPMTLGSRVLGLVLIAFGLTLLLFVLIGFIGSVRG